MSDTQERICGKILSFVNHWVDEQNPISEINTATVWSLGLSSEDVFNYLNPQLAKDVYYSPFVHKALTIGDNLYLVLEVVYCMAFTPSLTGWCLGIDMALESNANDNLIFCSINLMRDNYGCVSAGGYNRRQVSHGRRAMKKATIQSLIDLLIPIQFADSSDDTVELLVRFVKSPADDEVFLVGQLVAQEMINVLTKIGVISNHRHLTNVQIASGTKTSKRLKTLGVRSDTHRTELMPYLSQNLSVLLDKV